MTHPKFLRKADKLDCIKINESQDHDRSNFSFDMTNNKEKFAEKVMKSTINSRVMTQAYSELVMSDR